MGQDGSGSEFHVNFGSCSVGSLFTLVVVRVGLGQENWTHVKLLSWLTYSW